MLPTSEVTEYRLVKSDEYNLSTMKDTKGGFLVDETSSEELDATLAETSLARERQRKPMYEDQRRFTVLTDSSHPLHLLQDDVARTLSNSGRIGSRKSAKMQ